MFLLLFMGLVPHICGVKVHDVSTVIPTYAVNNNNLKTTLYSDESIIKCFQMEKEESFDLGPNEHIRNKLVAILYTSHPSRTANVVLAALYPDSCYYSLGKEINVKDDEFEVHLHGKGWAYFKDTKCEGKNLESNRLPDTSWSLLIPQDPNEYPYDPHFDKSKVIDVLTDFQLHSYGILENIKITVHTKTEFVLKCYELNDEEREKLDSNAKYVSILFNDIEGTNRVALLIMTTCDNMDKNIINVKDEMVEVWLSNDNWAYFENGKCKGKEFVNSQLPVTVWILQDSKKEDIFKKMSQGLGQGGYENEREKIRHTVNSGK
ncbi:uncharacterized protein LOC128994187 [Macrosteles quadrilineatus]|uniref:uncharacterized protein LOC128994187 n=1 Tax=Macrosteles quadrilineatus TaxID=74068 RepID=UPI0023E0BC09|nr:uncharacterized protein LOC128994187 [Macrosteles quadrilineatus]